MFAQRRETITAKVEMLEVQTQHIWDELLVAANL
jgi:hypothetical protein